jgi:hypothetical protein
MVGQRPIELQELSKYFNMPEKAVAKTLGICLTSLKKLARQNGITRWPYRKVTDGDDNALGTLRRLLEHRSSSFMLRIRNASRAARRLVGYLAQKNLHLFCLDLLTRGPGLLRLLSKF